MPRKQKRAPRPVQSRRPDLADRDTEVRIIGGQFRGRRLRYHGDPVVRPMKHRTREAIFNLVTTEVMGRHVIDLFGGTGALGLEALSRGAVRATFIEKHVPSARVLEENIRTLGVEDRAKLLITSALVWVKRDLPAAATDPHNNIPWLVFCSPPYALFVERQPEMSELIHGIQDLAPRGTVLVVEADQDFDFELLRRENVSGGPSKWSTRSYPPAVIGIWRSQP